MLSRPQALTECSGAQKASRLNSTIREGGPNRTPRKADFCTQLGDVSRHTVPSSTLAVLDRNATMNDRRSWIMTPTRMECSSIGQTAQCIQSKRMNN